MLDLPSIRRCLAAEGPVPIDEADGEARQAAVAVVLREGRDEADMLFIKRAVKAGDPWSGHMAFPGGHRDPRDATLRDAAIRETAEEIGLDISAAAVLGELPRQRPMSVRRNMLVAPFVFEIAGDPSFRLNHEVRQRFGRHSARCIAATTPNGPARRSTRTPRTARPPLLPAFASPAPATSFGA